MKSEVYNIDCLEYMRQLPDKAFDLAIADPPYGISIDFASMGQGTGVAPEKNARLKLNKSRLRGGGKLKDRAINKLDVSWDFEPPTQEFFDELFRVSKNQIIWGGNYFNLRPTRGIICWDKEQTFLNFSQWEMAWTSFDTTAKIFRFSNRGFTCPEKQEKIHPTQKPIKLYGWLLKHYAKAGDKIFDPMMGSQSSRIAAYKMGFDYAGCELDKEYFKAGCERFERECHGITKTKSGHTVIQTELFAQSE